MDRDVIDYTWPLELDGSEPLVDEVMIDDDDAGCITVIDVTETQLVQAWTQRTGT